MTLIALRRGKRKCAVTRWRNSAVAPMAIYMHDGCVYLAGCNQLGANVAIDLGRGGAFLPRGIDGAQALGGHCVGARRALLGG